LFFRAFPPRNPGVSYGSPQTFSGRASIEPARRKRESIPRLMVSAVIAFVGAIESTSANAETTDDAANFCQWYAATAVNSF
jgi:hypothetical protein